MLPSEAEFPYTIRLVSEVISSNGSTSQASVCGSTLALMDAGVPIKAPVAGISCGLFTEGERWMTMIDIQGVEDFYGDMDFKVAGTHKGITSIQMDLKIDGLTPEIIKEAFAVTHKGRDYIIDEILLKAIPAPRAEVSEYAPKMITMHINPDKIREVIGTGGKVIQKIVADTGAKIDIEDDGSAFIAATVPWLPRLPSMPSYLSRPSARSTPVMSQEFSTSACSWNTIRGMRAWCTSPSLRIIAWKNARMFAKRAMK